jgi:ribosomal protein L28
MSQICYLCAKKQQMGRISRHHRGVAGKQWLKRAQKRAKVFKANLQTKTINGIRMTLCAKCIKKVNREIGIAQAEPEKATPSA